MVADSGFLVYDSRFLVFDSRVLVSDSFGFRLAGFSFRLTGFGFRLTGFGFRFTAFCFRLTDFSFRLIAWPPFRRQARRPFRWRYWSTTTLGMRSIGCSSTNLLLKLLPIYGSVFVSSSLRLPPWGNLSLLPPCLLPCSGLLSSQRLIHSTWRYFAGGGTHLVYGQ